MFEGLQKKWNVGKWQLILILIIFAVGGSSTGFLSRKLMAWFYVEETLPFLVIYILIISFLWPAMVLLLAYLLVSFLFFADILLGWEADCLVKEKHELWKIQNLKF